MAVSVSLVMVLAAAVYVLNRYAGLKIWHGLICVMFGFYLAATSFAPEIRTAVEAIIHTLTGQGLHARR